MKYTCIPVLGGYALTEWIEKPYLLIPNSKLSTETNVLAMVKWESELLKQPSIPTLPEHQEHWKSKLYQVVEEWEFEIIESNSYGVSPIRYKPFQIGNNVPYAIPKQQQKEESPEDKSLRRIREVLEKMSDADRAIFIDGIGKNSIDYPTEEVKDDLWREAQTDAIIYAESEMGEWDRTNAYLIGCFYMKYIEYIKQNFTITKK